MTPASKMIELIVKRPMIRTVEIADLLDCEVDAVEPALKGWISGGEIVVHPITAPNGKPANAFDCSEKFKRSELYKAIVERIGGAIIPQKDVVETPPPQKSRREIAIDWMRTNGGSASDAELRRVMGLTLSQYPSTWLAPEIRSGLVHRDPRDDKLWRIGPAPKVAAGPFEVVKLPDISAPAPTCPPPQNAVPARESAKSEPVSAPTEIKELAPHGPAIGAPEPGGLAQQGKADTPEPGQLDAAPEAMEEARLPVEIDTAERVPQEAEPIDPLERAMLEDGIIKAHAQVQLVDAPRDPALDRARTGPSELRAAPPVTKPAEEIAIDMVSELTKGATTKEDLGRAALTVASLMIKHVPKPHFRCCRWSDKSVTLQRGDEKFELNSFEAGILLEQLRGVAA